MPVMYSILFRNTLNHSQPIDKDFPAVYHKLPLLLSASILSYLGLISGLFLYSKNPYHATTDCETSENMALVSKEQKKIQG